MRSRALFPAVVVGAIALSSMLLLPRLRTGAPEPASTDEAPITSTDVPIASGSAAPIPKPRPPVPAYVHRDPTSSVACLHGMLLIAGVYCPFVGHRCASFIDEDKDICREYAPEVLCEGRLQSRRYCIDEFEYPNLEGVYPATMADFGDANRACAVEGKRLCTSEEWEFACEGPQMWPYPYGLVRDPSACNIDRPHPEPTLDAFSDPWKISAEVDRLDQRVRSGELNRCVSPFGVRDMTGNVDEWVVNPAGKRDEKPFRSALKGGYWGPIRARCRPMTSTHNEWFSFYQAGFRCCADAVDHVALAPPPPNGPRRQRLLPPP